MGIEGKMRYSIFDFNQEKCVQEKLSMNQLLLLDYIQKAVANPKMKHCKSAPLCVWLNHQKIKKDLPILNISEPTLKRWLKDLVNKGLLQREVTYSESYGTRAYYGITDKLVDLQISGLTDDTRDSISGLTKDTLDNGLIKKDNDKTNSINTISKKSLVKNKSLYESCEEMILSYIKTKNNPELYDLLEQYLRLRLEMKEKPLYKNQWKGILNKLDRIHEEEGQEYADIIQFNIEKGYASFFPIPKYNSKPSRKKRICDEGVTNDKYTDEEWEEIKKWQQEQIAKGEQMVF